MINYTVHGTGRHAVIHVDIGGGALQYIALRRGKVMWFPEHPKNSSYSEYLEWDLWTLAPSGRKQAKDAPQFYEALGKLLQARES